MHPKVRDPLREDFRNLLYVIWKHLGLPNPTPVQYDIAKHLQDGPKRSIIEAFRGVGKSWICSAFVTWILYCNPQQKILVVSASKQRADDFSTFTKRIISEIPQLMHLKARVDQRDSNVAFDVGPSKAAHAPSVKSIGITGQIVGSRADVIVADDVEVLTNSLTQPMRDKLAEVVKEFDAVLTPTGRVIYLGTPQMQETLYDTLEPRGYNTKIWTARMPAKNKMLNYRGRLADYITNSGLNTGDPIDPDRFNDLDLTEREASYGRTGFDLQFMLDTTSSDANRFPLKLSDFIVTTVHPDRAPGMLVWGIDRKQRLDTLPAVGLSGDYFYSPMQTAEDMYEYTGKAMFIDPAGRGTDETGYCITYMLNGMIFVIKVGGLQGGYDRDTLKKLAVLARDYKVNTIQIESNFGDGMYTQLFKPVLREYYDCSVEEVSHNKQKELRMIDTLEPVLNQHRIVMDYGEILRDFNDTQNDPRRGLFYQLTRLTRDRGSLVHDDRVDALAMGISYWVEQVNSSIKTAYMQRKDDVLDNELRKFMEQCGQPMRSQRWN